MLTVKEMAEKQGVAESTLARWRKMGIGPEWKRFGEKTILYYDEMIMHVHCNCGNDLRIDGNWRLYIKGKIEFNCEECFRVITVPDVAVAPYSVLSEEVRCKLEEL